MNQPSTQTTITETFVVHTWNESSVAESCWRGRMEHMQGGQRADSLDVGGLLGFLEHFGISAAVLPASHF